MSDNKTIKTLLLVIFALYSVSVYQVSSCLIGSSQVLDNSPIVEYDQLLHRFPEQFGIVNIDGKLKADDLIEFCLKGQVEIFSEKAIREFLANNGDIMNSLGGEDVAKNKLKRMLEEAYRDFAKVINQMHFYQGQSQREALLRYGNWAAVMLEIYKNGKLDLNGTFKSLDKSILPDCEMSSPTTGQNKLRLVINPLAELTPIGSKLKEEHKGIVITIPDGSEGKEGRKQAEVERELKKINQDFFYSNFLPKEIYDSMPQKGKELVLNQMNLADIIAIISEFKDLKEFEEYFSMHGNKPEGWFWRYEVNRAKNGNMENINYYKRFHLPPFPTEEFAERYRKILGNAYQTDHKSVTQEGTVRNSSHLVIKKISNEFSLNSGFLGQSIIYKERAYFRKAANFFGYLNETTEPNRDEESCLRNMSMIGYPSIEYARRRRERFSGIDPRQRFGPPGRASSPEDQPRVINSAEGVDQFRTDGREKEELSFSRFKKEPFSFLINLIFSFFESIFSLFRSEKKTS